MDQRHAGPLSKKEVKPFLNSLTSRTFSNISSNFRSGPCSKWFPGNLSNSHRPGKLSPVTMLLKRTTSFTPQNSRWSSSRIQPCKHTTIWCGPKPWPPIRETHSNNCPWVHLSTTTITISSSWSTTRKSRRPPLRLRLRSSTSIPYTIRMEC